MLWNIIFPFILYESKEMIDILEIVMYVVNAYEHMLIYEFFILNGM